MATAPDPWRGLESFSVPPHFQVPARGFEIVKRRPLDDPQAPELDYLVPIDGPWVWKEPPKTLCRAFASLDCREPAALLAFANEHGWLGLLNRVEGEPGALLAGILNRIEGEPGAPTKVILGESLQDWHAHIRDVGAALHLIDALHKRSPLGRWISWHTKRPEARVCLKMTFDAGGEHRRIVDWIGQQEVERHHVKTAKDAVEYLVRRWVFQGLDGHMANMLLKGRKPFERGVRAMNLLGALWDQVADFAEGDQVHRRCTACGKWLLIQPGGGGRSDQVFCGSGCRSRAFRARHKRASKRSSKGGK